MWREMKNWAEGQGWQCEPRRLSGTYRGYQFTVFGYDGARFRVVTPAPQLSDEARGRMTRFFIGAKKQLRIEQYDFEGGMCLARLHDVVAAGTDKVLIAYLDAVTQELTAAGVPGRDHCGVCGAEGQHRLAWLNGVSLPVCEECFRSIETAQHDMADESVTPRNYGAGLFGAIIGGLIGAIPWVIVNRLGYFASILGAIIGTAAMFGYTRLGGKPGRATPWIIGLSTLISVIVAQLVTVALLFTKYEIAVSAHNFVVFFTDPELARSAWGDLGMGLFMGGLGVLGILQRLAKAGRVEAIARAE